MFPFFLLRGQLRENPSPKRVVNQLGAASQLQCVFTNSDSSKKIEASDAKDKNKASEL